MLRYNLKIHLLGQLSIEAGRFRFAVGKRAFATMGSRVRTPSEAALTFLCNVGLENDATAASLGLLAYGEHVTNVPVRFSVARLKGKRSFVFARAGYGKRNLIKYLVSQLYSSPPDVGLVIFDPEGEYALPDAHGRPGLANVPALSQRLGLYTNRRVPAQYASYRKGDVHVDFGDFPPQDIVAAFVPQEKQEMVFANMLRSLDWDAWRQLVQLLARDGYASDNDAIAKLLSYKPRQDDVTLGAIKNNLVPAIKRLHRPGAVLGKNILEELRQNRIVVVDISLLGSEDGLAISGMLLRRVFQHNIRHLTELGGPSVRCLAVIEEAQTVLGDRSLSDANIFVRWVKEGRKYGLGAIIVTQQPGAISDQIISQGDNFFVLHLLNDDDLQTLKRHNAYYTDEILNYLRAEPIVGNCYFWSAPSQPFVLPVRVTNFESICQKTTPGTTVSLQKRPAAIAQAVRNALETNGRVWLYPVRSYAGREERGYLAFSSDYLHAAVCQTVDADSDEVKKQIAAVLARHNVRVGYAVLEGITRQVWVISETELKLRSGKRPRPTPVDVSDRF
jgi:DNA helicase HerA-like ATPase